MVIAVDMLANSYDDVLGVLPPFVVKNTFFEVVEPSSELSSPKSQSCPLAAFVGSGVGSSEQTLAESFAGNSDLQMCDLAAAARMFSAGSIPRDTLEASGHVSSRPAFESGEKKIGSSRPLPPPPLLELDLPETSVPDVPAWSPKCDGCISMHARPMPPALETPVGCLLGQTLQLSVASTAATQHAVFHDVSAYMSMATPSTQRSETWYRVAYLGGVAVRSGPFFDAARTGVTLASNEVFSVSQSVPGADGRIYLCLTDGRGWVFDDSALMPQDPSVVRGCWAPLSASARSSLASPPTTPWQPMEEPLEPEAMKKKRRRRKRGGVKRRPKSKAANSVAEAEVDPDLVPSEAESDLDLPPSDGRDTPSDAEAETEAPPSDGRNTPTDEEA
jgi:hypothetical protein